jgi:hypothetical protein
VKCASGATSGWLVLEGSPLALIVGILKLQSKPINFGDIGKQVKAHTKKNWTEQYKDECGSLAEFCRGYTQFFIFSHGGKQVSLCGASGGGGVVEYMLVSAGVIKGEMVLAAAFDAEDAEDTEEQEPDVQSSDDLEAAAGVYYN